MCRPSGRVPRSAQLTIEPATEAGRFSQMSLTQYFRKMQVPVITVLNRELLISPSTIQKLPASFATGLRPITARLGSEEGRTRFISHSLLVALVLPLIGMHLLGVERFYWFGLNVVAWDFAILFSGLILLLLVLFRAIEIPARLPIIFYLIAAMAVWFAVEAARSPTPFRGWTMVLLLLRDIVMFGAVFLALTKRPDIERLNFWISILGLSFTAIAVSLFLMNLNATGERLPFNGVIVLFETTTPRIIGFARDPNFFGLTVAISLLTLPFAIRIPAPLRWLGAALLITALFFTGSRMVPASLLAAIVLFGSIAITRRQNVSVRQLLNTLVPGLLIALIVMPVWFLIPGDGPSLGTRLIDRYEIGVRTPRTELWAETVSGFGSQNSSDANSGGALNQIISYSLGGGLRSNQENLSGQYSHNTYLDLIGETGIVGLVLWLTITSVVTIQVVKSMRTNPGLAPWLAIWLTTLFFSYGFSVLVAPYYWFIAAVITGIAIQQSSSARANLQSKPDYSEVPGLGRLASVSR